MRKKDTPLPCPPFDPSRYVGKTAAELQVMTDGARMLICALGMKRRSIVRAATKAAQIGRDRCMIK